MGNKLLYKKQKQTLSKLLRNTKSYLSIQSKHRVLLIFGTPDATDDNACDYFVKLEATETPKRKNNKLRTMIQDIF